MTHGGHIPPVVEINTPSSGIHLGITCVADDLGVGVAVKVGDGGAPVGVVGQFGDIVATVAPHQSPARELEVDGPALSRLIVGIEHHAEGRTLVREEIIVEFGH